MTDPELQAAQERKQVRATFASRAFVIAAIVLAVVIVGMQLTTTLQIAAQQDTNTGNAATTKRLAEQIASCTTPGEPCSDRAQKQTSSAVADINRVVILAAACSTGLGRHLTVVERQSVIQSCVINRLAASRS